MLQSETYPRKGDYVIGNSVGEYTGLVAAGILDPYECIRILQIRGRMMQECFQDQSYGMFAVSCKLTDRKVFSLVQQLALDVAVVNSPNQIIVSGTLEDLKKFQISLKDLKIRGIFLKVSGAFHSKYLRQMQP